MATLVIILAICILGFILSGICKIDWLMAIFALLTCVIVVMIFDYEPPVKKETPITIYTQNDIIYIYQDSLTSESGDIIVKNGEWKQAFIEEITARHSITVDLPEEISLIDSTDCLSGYMKKDSLFLSYKKH